MEVSETMSYMIFGFLFSVFVIVAWMFSEMKANDEARSDRKIDEAVEKRDITEQDLQNIALTKERKEYAKKQIVKAAKTDAQQKNAQYKNYFSQKEHSEIYRSAYRRLRKEYIREKAFSDVKNKTSQVEKFHEPAEQKMYQEAYVEFKAEEKRRDHLTPWTEEERNVLPVDNDDFVEMFVKGAEQKKNTKITR